MNLTYLLETIKTGKVGTTISDTIERIKKELGPFWEDIKFQVGLFIDNVKMVYNFEVENTHTYFAENYLVHNK